MSKHNKNLPADDRSLNIANAINNNINNEMNDYQFTFDVPTETEIQKDMEDIWEKTPPTPPPPCVPPPLLTKKEIEIERNKANKEFIKTSLLMNKDELDAANVSADQKNKKVIKDIIDPTPGPFIDDQLKPNEQNLNKIQQTTFLIFHLRCYNSLMKLCLKKSLNTL